LNELFVVAFRLDFAVDFKVALSMAFVVGTRMEETFAPFASVSCALATLAFFAVFKVLIRDFFWMDIVGSGFKIFVFASDAIPICNRRANLFRALREPPKTQKSMIYRELRRTLTQARWGGRLKIKPSG
jgi:hypothetical protein